MGSKETTVQLLYAQSLVQTAPKTTFLYCCLLDTYLATAVYLLLVA
jgi:hypothetical protein